MDASMACPLRVSHFQPLVVKKLSRLAQTSHIAPEPQRKKYPVGSYLYSSTARSSFSKVLIIFGGFPCKRMRTSVMRAGIMCQIWRRSCTVRDNKHNIKQKKVKRREKKRNLNNRLKHRDKKTLKVNAHPKFPGIGAGKRKARATERALFERKLAVRLDTSLTCREEWARQPLIVNKN